MKKVAFLGDFNIDIIMDGLEAAPVPDHEIACASFDLAMGASSCIAAAAYARLGGDAWMCGLSGRDEFGRLMLEGLREAGVRTDHVRQDPSVRTGVTVNLVQGSSRYQVTYQGTIAAFTLHDVPDALFDGLRHLHVSGVYQAKSLLPHVSVLLARAAASGATTSLDCQWDPAARWESLDAWLPSLDWLFANAQEALSMTGRSSVREALRALGARTRCPVIKTGREGALVLVDGREVAVPGAAVDVVDTIGAGDNFDAAFLYAVIEEELSLPDAVRPAIAAAARSCTFRGGTAARSTWDDIQRFMETHA